MTDKRWCFGCMDCYITGDCWTCKDTTECWNKTFEELRREPLEPEVEEDAGTIAR